MKKIENINGSGFALPSLTSITDKDSGKVLLWSKAKYDKDENPFGFKDADKDAYFVQRFFLENHIGNWGEYIWITSEKTAYRYEDGVWNPVDEIVNVISYYAGLYFGRASSKLIKSCFQRFQQFYARTTFTAASDIIAYLDCALDRKKLMKKEIEFVDLEPAMQITSPIPHRLKEIFGQLQEKGLSQWNQYDILNLIKQTPINLLLSAFFSKDIYSTMIYAGIADLIDTSLPEQWIFLLQSQVGGTGKGTVISLLQDIVGLNSSFSADKEALKNTRFVYKEFIKPRMYIADETDEELFKGGPLSILKSTSGGASKRAEWKGANKEITFIPKGVWWITTNDIPRLPPTEVAFFRRLVLLPMLNAYPFELDELTEILEKIQEEMSMLIGLCSLLIPFVHSIHQSYIKLINPAKLYTSIITKAEYNFFDYFVRQKEVWDKDDLDYLLLGDIHSSFLKYCEYENLIPSSSSKDGFGRMFTSYIKKNRFKYLKNRKTVNKIKQAVYYGIEIDDLSIDALKVEVVQEVQPARKKEIFSEAEVESLLDKVPFY